VVFVGGGLVILAGFWPRIQGVVELDKDGMKVPIAAVERAERQLEERKVIDAADTVGIVDTFEAVLSQHGVAQGEQREIAPPLRSSWLTTVLADTDKGG
jgi:hypothetical protein